MPNVAIIILNWNGWENTLACLESLYKISYSNYEVTLVDNGSADNSVEKINKWVNQKKIKITFILNKKNAGFVGGNNIAMQKILNGNKNQYVLLLNNDTIVSPNFLTELVKVAEDDRKVGIVGPKLYYFNYQNRRNIIQSAGAKINLFTGQFVNYGDKQTDRGQLNQVTEVDHICGACLLIRRQIINKIGLLDTKYFSYFEDVDWSLKVKQKGYKILYVPYSHVWHKGGESLSSKSELSEYYNTRNVFLIEKKFATTGQFLFFLGYYFLFRFPKRIVYCCISKNKIKMLSSYVKGLQEGILNC